MAFSPDREEEKPCTSMSRKALTRQTNPILVAGRDPTEARRDRQGCDSQIDRRSTTGNSSSAEHERRRQYVGIKGLGAKDSFHYEVGGESAPERSTLLVKRSLFMINVWDHV